MNLYTGKGDLGETDTLGRGRISKDSPIAGLLGDIDELVSSIGLAISFIGQEDLTDLLSELQNKLFKVSADVVSSSSKKVKNIDKKDVEWLEKETDKISEGLPKTKKFVLPGRSQESALLHVSRAIARRAERSAVAASKSYEISPEVLAFMNRTSSFLFACALLANKNKGKDEKNPSY
jgi:cob(I)alamin adenosyltransferase